MMNAIRDWWRGWSDEDLANVLTKIVTHSVIPGAVIPVTARELRAHQAYLRDGYSLRYHHAGDL